MMMILAMNPHFSNRIQSFIVRFDYDVWEAIDRWSVCTNSYGRWYDESKNKPGIDR